MNPYSGVMVKNVQRKGTRSKSDISRKYRQEASNKKEFSKCTKNRVVVLGGIRQKAPKKGL